MGKKKEWIEILAWDAVRCRTIMETDKGMVVDMVVQLEINDSGWKPIARYNFAHGRPHRDLIVRGKTIKTWLEGSLGDIFTYARVDIRSHWKQYLEECGYVKIE
jgi:hypothetical protein